MLSHKEILETIHMISRENLDVRTITMGISLMDCIAESKQKTSQKIYDKIAKYAKNLVRTGEEISSELGIPIVNKRVSVTPISLISCASRGHFEIAAALDKIAAEIGIDFLGGYSALVHKGMSSYEEEFIKSIPSVLSGTKKLCSSVNVGSTKSGINMYAVRLLGQIIKQAAELTKDADSIACSKFVAFCNAVEDNPFMAGAFHGTGEDEIVINVGVSGPGAVKSAIENLDAALDDIAERIKQTAFKITRIGQLVAVTAAKRLNAAYGIVDLSLAPTPVTGDSVAHILEEIGLESVGGHGTTACLALLNDAVKKGGVMASSHVGGLSGAFIPVSEDIGMINAAKSGALTFDKLEAMTAVCSVGLDMIAVPGDTSADIISAIIADESAIGMVNNKTTAVRIIPVFGKTAGEMAEFGGLLGRAPIIDVHRTSPAKFISRGGIIPAPLHSLKN